MDIVNEIGNRYRKLWLGVGGASDFSLNYDQTNWQKRETYLAVGVLGRKSGNLSLCDCTSQYWQQRDMGHLAEIKQPTY